MPYPVFPDIPVSIRNRNAVVGGTSAIDYPTAKFGMPIDLVVPWDLPYIYDDRAKITVGAQTGTVSFGRQVGTRYRMAHIRGIQIAAETIETGTITVASAVDQQPPTYSAGDAAFQAWFIQNWPSIEFGDRTDRRGSWRPTGGASSMTRIEIAEIEPGRTVLKGWGRVPNASVFKPAEIRTMSANSLMFMWWCYFWPETALVKWEMAFWYCDANNGAYRIYTLPEMSIGVPDRLHLDVKWRNQRLVDAASRTPYVVGSTRYHDFLDVAAVLGFGQGAGFSGHFLDTSRLAHTEQDYECLTDYDLRASTYQYWINAIADRATWQGKCPVWLDVPNVPTSIADPLVFDALTSSKYIALMNTTAAQPDPVFSHDGALWVASVTSPNQSGDQEDYGHGKASMYWGLNPAGNPDAIEIGYFGVIPQFGVGGKFYHQGPDEPQRQDAGQPRKNHVDGRMYEINYVNGQPDEDQTWLWPRSTENDHRIPIDPFNWIDGTRILRGEGNEGSDGGHCSNYGILYAAVTTGSWLMLELVRQQTTRMIYATHPWGYETVSVKILEQQRWARQIQMIVNGYWAEHDPVRRARIIDHFRCVAEKNDITSGPITFWQGFQPWRQAGDAFFAAPNRAVFLGESGTAPNFDPPLAYSATSVWQLGTCGSLYHMAMIADSASMKRWVWAAWYSFLRYCWENFAAAPAVPYMEDVGDSGAAAEAAKCPGWLVTGYVSTPGMVVSNPRNPFGGDGWGPDTAYPDWLTQTKTAEAQTRNSRLWWSREKNSITNVTTGAQPVVTVQRALPAWLTGQVNVWFHYTDTTPKLDGIRLCDVTGANTLRLVLGQVNVTDAGDPDGFTSYNTPWIPTTDEGIAANATFNSYPDGRRWGEAGPGADWDHHYSVPAVRIGRLVTAFMPNEVERNQFLLDRIEDILGSWSPRHHATVYAETLNGWREVLRDMDWRYPTNYEPGPGNRQVTARPQSFAQHPQLVLSLLAGGVRPIVTKIQRRIPDKDFSGVAPGDDLTRSVETRLREAQRQPGVNTPAQGSVPAERRRGRLARRRDRLEEDQT